MVTRAALLSALLATSCATAPTPRDLLATSAVLTVAGAVVLVGVGVVVPLVDEALVDAGWEPAQVPPDCWVTTLPGIVPTAVVDCVEGAEP